MSRREAATMGFELESTTSAPRVKSAGDAYIEPLEQRWHTANDRLAAAIAAYRSLRDRVAPGDPAWVAAQLRVAEARQRCCEVADDIEVFGPAPDAGRRRR